MSFGELENQLATWPLKFCTSVAIINNDIEKLSLNTGTASLLNLRGKRLAITCHHVFEEYIKRLRKKENVSFYIGNLLINPLDNMVAKNHDLDLVILDLSKENLTAIDTDFSDVKTDFFIPYHWPPHKLDVGDILTFGGFPAVWRSQIDFTKFEFSTFSHGACEVASVNLENNHFYIQLNKEEWVHSHSHLNANEISDFGGLSGAPVFVIRKLFFELVGIIFEVNHAFELIKVRSLRVLTENGNLSY